ncbi:MAG: aminotransferase class III-fold pyridoxal phosphate-dependent enzyme, partial [Gammaproteobacteria bacterium]|nr:aminotransferase class III-fold pyridoxal phosphate-dependent enzyme [Gammaproteobacteria bacterium]
VFDEVVSGFRMAPGGAQARYGVTPDLSTFGKAVAGGMPLAGFAGINKVMNLLDNNAVSHLGTYNSNAICATAALATLRELKKDDGAILNGIRHTGCMLRDGLNDIFHHQQVAMVAHGPGSVVSVYANDKVPKNYRDTLTHNTALLTRFHQLLLQHGVWIFARGNWMLSSAHHQQEIDETLEKTEQVIVQIKLNHAGVL